MTAVVTISKASERRTQQRIHVDGVTRSRVRWVRGHKSFAGWMTFWWSRCSVSDKPGSFTLLHWHSTPEGLQAIPHTVTTERNVKGVGLHVNIKRTDCSHEETNNFDDARFICSRSTDTANTTARVMCVPW